MPSTASTACSAVNSISVSRLLSPPISATVFAATLTEEISASVVKQSSKLLSLSPKSLNAVGLTTPSVVVTENCASSFGPSSPLFSALIPPFQVKRTAATASTGQVVSSNIAGSASTTLGPSLNPVTTIEVSIKS